MGANTTVFEVTVVVKTKTRETINQIGYGVLKKFTKSLYIEDTNKKVFHISARTSEQAGDKAEAKYGRVLSVRKLSPKIIGDIENLRLEQEPYDSGNPYQDALAMDEFIWRKHQVRRENNRKHDKNIF